MIDLRSNTPEPVSVSELSQKLKRTLETTFDYVRVRGELSKVKIYGSGHLYTDLKDENSVINSICWKGVLNGLSIRPEEGLEVICTGKITTYPARSNYQLIIDSMELAGQGALLKMLEDRRKKLEAEGLFAVSRKKTLPYIPTSIGLITSPSGAVIHDILHRISDRFPRHVLLWPATVQGPNTVRDVVGGLQAFNALSEAEKPDIIIIARGGGSLEDLMPFNEEAIVRAVAASLIPVISAVGHETDTTLCDHAADRRAPTPTAAAEMAVPVLADLINTLSVNQQRLQNIILNRLKHDRNELRHRQQAMGDPMQILNIQYQKLDYIALQSQQCLQGRLGSLAQRFTKASGALRDPKMQVSHAQDRLQSEMKHLDQSLKNKLSDLSHRLTKTAGAIRHPQMQIKHAHEKLHVAGPRLDPAFNGTYTRLEKHVNHAGLLLESLSFKKTLARGFAVVTNPEGHVVTAAAEAVRQTKLNIRFADDVVIVTPEKP